MKRAQNNVHLERVLRSVTAVSDSLFPDLSAEGKDVMEGRKWVLVFNQ